MGRPDDTPGETPEQLKKRANDLRECARKARELAKRLGPLLDGSAKKAAQSDPAIWRGPFATRSTGTLVNRKTSVNQMASALLHDAGRWEAEATSLDEQAKAAGAKPKAGAGAGN
ncbi:hypothetical protein DWB77_00718 [Streptomyces hundungensis]|uniref:Uncharacterized protein n=1 Tax=Streptomyces hundungensis TaxID=1077946 RepID=A0A387HCC3_9ACTN|nr:hypothetical protein [Streptomyces hundungensis]AYG78610.1 hypothetical protein DWB77_00718 [Streptomyces hundungensis]